MERIQYKKGYKYQLVEEWIIEQHLHHTKMLLFEVHLGIKISQWVIHM